MEYACECKSHLDYKLERMVRRDFNRAIAQRPFIPKELWIRIVESNEGSISTKMTDLLKRYGWNQFFEQQFASLADEGLIPGRVIAQQRNSYTLKSEQGDLSAHIAGKVRYHARGIEDLPAVGDWVVVTNNWRWCGTNRTNIAAPNTIRAKSAWRSN